MRFIYLFIYIFYLFIQTCFCVSFVPFKLVFVLHLFKLTSSLWNCILMALKCQLYINKDIDFTGQLNKET